MYREKVLREDRVKEPENPFILASAVSRDDNSDTCPKGESLLVPITGTKTNSVPSPVDHPLL